MSFVVSGIVDQSPTNNILNGVHADDWTAEWAIIASNVHTKVKFVLFHSCPDAF